MSTLDVKVPGIGDFKDVPVIEVHVKPGDTVNAEDPLVTIESEKATFDVPAPAAGTIREVKLKVGDKVSEGTSVATIEAGEAPASAKAAKPAAPSPAPAAEEEPSPPRAAPARAAAEPEAPAPPASGEGASPASAPAAAEPAPEARRAGGAPPHASPSVRKFARELGVDLGTVTGSGPKGRILQDDVQRTVKEAMTGGARGPGLSLLPWPKVDFEKFGPVERRPLGRIQKLSGPNLQRNWVTIPHVTQHDEADVTDLEDFRQALNREHAKDGVKVTILAFVMKACVAALKVHPELNASLDGDALVLKRYFHLGFAADTPNGLVVPVLRDADRKGVLDIARELGVLAAKARDGKLGPADVQGGTFSISSLGGIGGTAFTPIINAPEVAILGVSRSATRPVWNGEAFAPRLVLPLSLSYDHRVVDGALAARFTTTLSGILGDMRRAML